MGTEPVLRATHGSPDHPLRIGEMEIPCYVLEDGRRVLHQRGMVKALGMSRGGSSRGGGDRLAHFVAQKTLGEYVTPQLLSLSSDPIKFKTPRGKMAYGYDATVLADICDAILSARQAKKLSKQQFHIGEQAEILVRGFARVGIVALVDEVTGYQESRDKDALQQILDAFLRKELAAWAKRFPDEFYKEMFRLRGWKWRGMSVNRPSVVGKYTNDLVYERLAPSILTELERKNPKDASGKRKSKHHQWLTDDVGHPALAQHIHAIIGFMRASQTWGQFYRLIQRAFPKRGSQLELPIDTD